MNVRLLDHEKGAGLGRPAAKAGRASRFGGYRIGLCVYRAGSALRALPALLLLAASMSLAACAGDGGGLAAGGSLDSFQGIQDNLLAPKCATAGCHNSATAAGSLDLSDAATSRAEMLGVASLCGGKVLVAANDAAGSYLLDKIGAGSEPCGSLMPLGAPALTQAEVDALVAWIEAGAPPAAAALVATVSSTSSTSSTSTSTTLSGLEY